jgi:hypothetical protein
MSREESWQTKFFVLSDTRNRSPAQTVFNDDDDEEGDAEKSLK